jgi:transposase InsO family protein
MVSTSWTSWEESCNKILDSFDFACNKSQPHICPAYQFGKQARLPFTSSDSSSFFPFQLIHSDVWTSLVTSVSGYKYYLVILDDYTHYVWTFPMRCKSDVLPLLLAFHAYVHTQFHLPIVALQTDNDKEFDNFALHSFFSHHGIALRLSYPYTSQQNGKAERVLRTLNNCARSLLFHASMPPQYWAESLATTTYLFNRQLCLTTSPQTPHELLAYPPKYQHMRVFDCLYFPNQFAMFEHKLAPQLKPCVFLGYSLDHKDYHYLCLDTR